MRNAMGILAALGGRFQWRWWAAVAVWLAVAIGAYPVLMVRRLQYTDFPALVLVFATAAALLLIWAWGTRYALSLGYRRGPVYLVTVIASFAMVWGTYLLQQVARVLEFQVAGNQGLRVFLATYPGSKFYTEDFVDTFMATLLMLGTPFAIAALCGITFAMRWGIAGGVLGILGAAVLAIGAMWLASETSYRTGVPFEVLPAFACVLGLAAAWWAFRKQPV